MILFLVLSVWNNLTATYIIIEGLFTDKCYNKLDDIDFYNNARFAPIVWLVFRTVTDNNSKVSCLMVTLKRGSKNFRVKKKPKALKEMLTSRSEIVRLCIIVDVTMITLEPKISPVLTGRNCWRFMNHIWNFCYFHI